MKFIHPLNPFVIDQAFGANANPLYAGEGVKGHTGLDLDGAYGQTIVSAADAYLYSTINMGASPNRYRAVFTLADEVDFSYEVSYGHVIDCLHPIGTTIRAGEPIARVGNFGDVYAGGHYVTEAEKLAGSQAGKHLHFQVRKCIKVSDTITGKQYLQDANGYVKSKEGLYYEVVDYYAGYNGCIDPAPFFTETKYKFTRDLSFGSFGQDVVELQKRLGINPTFPIFGPKTRTKLVEYQIAHGISPAKGFFGPVTRASFNQ